MNKLSISKEFSDYIGCSRIILCILVVYIHARMLSDLPADVHIGVIYYIKAISLGVASTAVPIFMLFSGYLLGFKYRKEGCTFSSYKTILKKKARSLLIPYMIWNLLCLGIILVKHYFNSTTAVPTLWGTFYGFSENNDSFLTPADGPLWFVRNLMIFNIFSPIFYFVISSLKEKGTFVISVVYILYPLGSGIPFGGGHNAFSIGMVVSVS